MQSSMSATKDRSAQKLRPKGLLQQPANAQVEDTTVGVVLHEEFSQELLRRVGLLDRMCFGRASWDTRLPYFI